MKKLVALIVIAALIISCSGCSLNFFSVESLITPPMQSGENGEVQKAFNTLMKDTKFQLKTPVSGDYQTSFVLIDINADGSDEAFVFYSDASSVESSVRMAFMECINEEWKITSDIKGAGSGVYDINFVDLNGDGVSEIFVSWSLLDSKNTRIVSIFEIAIDKNNIVALNSLGNEYSDYKAFLDFNNDGADDLIVIYLDDTGAVQKSYFRIFSLSENHKLTKYGETVLDSAIASISSVKTDSAVINGEKVTRVFADCFKNDRMIFTELVYWDSVHKVPVKEFTEPSITNLRSSDVLCRDIDNDGFLEIPSLTHLYGDENTFVVKSGEDSFTFTLLQWNNAKGDSGGKILTTLLNPVDRYLFHFEWGSKVTIKYDSLRESLLFCKWDEANKQTGDELFSIACRSELAENEILGNLLLDTDTAVYYYQITESGYDFGLRDETINSSFIKID